METLDALFEVSWEVGHKVGGIHTSISTKARTLVEQLGERYLAVGPWLLSEQDPAAILEPVPGFEAFSESCREAGVPVRVGRWKIPGRPRTVLVEFSGLYAQKDQVLADLWDRYRVDSLFGGWEYIEPVLFGHAASLVIERWWRAFHRAPGQRAAAIFHEWMTGSGLLGLASRVPEIGRVATTHATVVGRALGATGQRLPEGLGGRSVADVATTLGVRASHSLETAFAREADVFTTVSGIAADECEVLHERRPDLLVPNGLDLDVLAGRVGGAQPAEARAVLLDVATRLLGEALEDPFLVVTAGRLEMHNKGYDVLLDAVAQQAATPGRPLVVFLFVLAGHGGVRPDVADRLAGRPTAGPLAGVSTHVLFAAEDDPIARRCRDLGLDNVAGGRAGRVRVIHVPARLDGHDGVLDLSYEALLQGADLACFPSFYEAWGYTPQESLALGVETVTTDCAGFGLWAAGQGIGADEGVHVLARRGVGDEAFVASLADLLQRLAARPGATPGDPAVAAARRARSERARATAWSSLIAPYREAAVRAGAAGETRRPKQPARAGAAPRAAAEARARRPGPRLRTLDVPAVVPPALVGLHELARNWRWVWDEATTALWSSLAPATWEAVGRNPVRLLREAAPEDLARCAADPAFLARVGEAVERLRAHLLPTGPAVANPVAYLSAEFGLHESLPIYSGGLGVLAGDHVKAASDLDVPLVAVGILYRQGYLRQRLRDGVEQVSLPDPLDPGALALEPVLGKDGTPLEITIQLPGSHVCLRAWRADVGRVPLYLLDAACPRNRPEDQRLTDVLYGGDTEHRIRQEIVLGRGAVRLLDRIGILPAVWHINEGHGAFAVLERAGQIVQRHGLTFAEAREYVRATTLFTTHTPVPAGHDRFSEDLMRRHFSDVPQWLGLPWDVFFDLGESPNEQGVFDMTLLALHFSSFVNGVSRKHRDVSRALLQSRCPQHLVAEFPVHAVTNGIHLPSWTHPRIAAAVGAGAQGVQSADFAARAPGLAADELWARRRELKQAFHEGVRARLVASTQGLASRRAVRERLLAGLDPDALNIGFARRFATYKRADMLFRDVERLHRLLDSTTRPVRLFFAGKAHPRDTAGLELLARVAGNAWRDDFLGRVFVLENYDIGLGRLLVQGVDVWLNTPRAPEEASGTSGMKAAANGALNLSIGDGWWLEGYDGVNGWIFGGDADPIDPTRRDELDADALYRILETEVVPEFFDRDAAGVPQAWVQRVRRALATVPPVFSTERMVAEYRDRAYVPLAAQRVGLRARDFERLRAQSAAEERLRRGFDALRILSATLPDVGSAPIDQPLAVALEVDLGALRPDDVVVELVFTQEAATALDEVQAPTRVALAVVGGPTGSGTTWRYATTHAFARPGRFQAGLRIRPARPERAGPALHDRVVWA